MTKLTAIYLLDLASHLTDIVTRLADRIERGNASEPTKPHAGLEAFGKDPFDQYPEEEVSRAVEPKR